jgi:cyclohexanone monooxygenase
MATGALSEPKLPAIDEIGSFAGPVFHSARWDHGQDLTGRRVAVIGTGASAIQLVPEIADQAVHLDVYQRTAPWVMPRRDRAYTDVERRLFRRVPLAQRLVRAAAYWRREAFLPMFTVSPRIAAPARKAALGNIRKGITDPDLRRRVTPDFEIGCKRILFSNDWYPTLARPDVELVTDPVARVTPHGLRTRDGVERPADVLVLATGFRTTDLPIARHIHGRDGRSLGEVWGERGMAAYKGTTVHGFPNLFLLVGPNTGLGHTSMVFMIESQITYLLDALETMRRRGVTALEPARTAQQQWNDDLQARLRRTVWNTGGCWSWYLDEHGRNVTLWPRATFTFRRLTARFDVEAYDATPLARSRQEVAG